MCSCTDILTKFSSSVSPTNIVSWYLLCASYLPTVLATSTFAHRHGGRIWWMKLKCMNVNNFLLGNNKSFSEWFPVYSTFPLFILTSNFFLKLSQMCCLTAKSFKIGIILVFENHKAIFLLIQNSSISHIQTDLSHPMNYLTKL